ncbi:twin-arginine translocation signal domain-containing protein [Acidimicrobiia bacterium EGI L10123]|uniref:twin-arginine translocation signal domain-containing protein n=1 Tax=Salinilacustrithrix flava TaxID=2957203 RepID=UPI003D7C31B7|nr:twin-arginine translocation signal domain-containing protein [Acidimicrobiia bacterium EGI L10123]
MGSTDQTSGVSRRDLLKKSAVAGGIVWAAPLILSDTAGATYIGSPADCVSYYWCKGTTNDTGGEITGVGGEPSHCYTPAPGGSGPANPPEYVPGRTYGSACGTVKSFSDNTITLYANLDGDTSKAKIQAVSGYTKGGAGEGSCAVAAVKKNADGTWTITFPLTTNAGGFSHVEFAFCV